jgi:Hsp20/alpha crystallin family
MRRWIGGRSRCSVASPVMAPSCRRPTSSRPTARMSSRVELPGVRREDVDVNLNGNELVVTGEVKERKREGLFRRLTRRVGEFELRVTLRAIFGTRHRGVLGAWRADRLCTEGREHQVKQDHCQ